MRKGTGVARNLVFSTMTFRFLSDRDRRCGLSVRRSIAVLAAMSGLMLAPMLMAQTPVQGRSYSKYASPAPVTQRPAAITPGASVVEDVVVRINDQIISRSDIERAEEQMDQELKQSGASPADIAQRQHDLLRDLIDKQLLISKGKELGLNVDAEVLRQLDNIRKQNHFNTMEDLEKAAAEQGVSFEDFKADIRNSMLQQEVVRNEVGRHISMTQAEAQRYYEAHKEEYSQPESIHLSEILVPVSADANDTTVSAAQGKANAIVAKLQAGAKFEDLAKAESGGPTAAQGGDLGNYCHTASSDCAVLAKPLEDKTFPLPAGGITDPIRTRQGFVILKVTEHHAAGIPPMKEVMQQVEEGVFREQMQPALRAYLTQLRVDAYIIVKSGFIDSGASPNQSEPTYTAYTPPAVKKKPTLEKTRFDRGGRFSNTATAKTPSAPTTATSTPTPATTTPTPTPPAPTSTNTTKPAAKSAKTASNSKPKKIKKEKIRYGQAPRESLPEASTNEVASNADAGNTGDKNPLSAQLPDPNVATTASTSAINEDPLGPKAAEKKKTRYSSRVSAPKVKKPKSATAAAAKVAPPTSEELATQKTQAAPLGLNGDTAKKKKKQKKTGPKERIQDKDKQPTAPADTTPAPSIPTVPVAPASPTK